MHLHNRIISCLIVYRQKRSSKKYIFLFPTLKVNPQSSVESSLESDLNVCAYIGSLHLFYGSLYEVMKVQLLFHAVEFIAACLMSCLACLMKSDPVWCSILLSLKMRR